MSELTAYIEAAERACFALAQALRSQVGVECLVDSKSAVPSAIARTKVALSQALAALEKVGK